jgi:hypothetical protein
MDVHGKLCWSNEAYLKCPVAGLVLDDWRNKNENLLLVVYTDGVVRGFLPFNVN